MSTPKTDSEFLRLLSAQIGNELDAHTQYVAIAVWFDSHDLPRLASHYYRQAVEERNHAMMLVQYMLDRDLDVQIPAGTAPLNHWDDMVLGPLKLALTQEQEVTNQIEAIFRAARAEHDALGEQFMLWFLKEQVEEVASANTLVTVAERADSNLFDLENFVARETIGDGGHHDGEAPAAAGGAI